MGYLNKGQPHLDEIDYVGLSVAVRGAVEEGTQVLDADSPLLQAVVRISGSHPHVGHAGRCGVELAGAHKAEDALQGGVADCALLPVVLLVGVLHHDEITNPTHLHTVVVRGGIVAQGFGGPEPAIDVDPSVDEPGSPIDVLARIVPHALLNARNLHGCKVNKLIDIIYMYTSTRKCIHIWMVHRVNVYIITNMYTYINGSYLDV
jgi:hypothetical protein